jgi:IS5 family transposase
VNTKAGVDEEQKRKNRTKARVRAKVEWPFRALKRAFGFVKVRYRGLKKNHEWLCAAFAVNQRLSTPQEVGQDQPTDGPSGA